MNKQQRLLAILLIGLGLSLAYAYFKTPRQERAPLVEAGTASTRDDGGREPGAPYRVALEKLAREKESFPGTRRDLFGPLFVVKPPPPPPRQPQVLPPPPPPPQQPTAPPPVQAAELARFTFLGYLEKEGEKTIFLSSADDLFLAKVGDRFGRDQQFRVTDLSPDKLVIRQGDDPRPITINLVEQTPLKPSLRTPPPPTRPGPAFPRRTGVSIPRPQLPVPAVSEEGLPTGEVEAQIPVPIPEEGSLPPGGEALPADADAMPPNEEVSQ